MERILGKVKIKGFRAPTFSLDNRTKWALKVLLDHGYQYDASIFPVKLNPLYGMDGAPAQPYRISFEDVRKEDPHSPLLEFPLPLLTIGRLKIPISGGFYLRDFPDYLPPLGIEENQSKGSILSLLPPVGKLREDSSVESSPLQLYDYVLWQSFCIGKTGIPFKTVPVYKG